MTLSAVVIRLVSREGPGSGRNARERESLGREVCACMCAQVCCRIRYTPFNPPHPHPPQPASHPHLSLNIIHSSANPFKKSYLTFKAESRGKIISRLKAVNLAAGGVRLMRCRSQVDSRREKWQTLHPVIHTE